MTRTSVISIVLVTLCLWLGWSVYGEINRSKPSTGLKDRPASSASPRSTSKADQSKTMVFIPPIEALDDIVSRPLFNISRRPIAVEQPKPKSKPSAKLTELNVMLSGIVIGRSRQIAHLRSAADNQTRALSVGDKIDDWQIVSIFPDHVVLRSGSRVETLFMQKPGSGNRASSASKSKDAKSPRRASKRTKTRSRRSFRRKKRQKRQ